MTLLADLLSTVFDRRYRRDIPSASRDDRSLTVLASALVGSEGETSGLVIAQEILGRYEELSDPEKVDFFRHLAVRMNIDPDTVRAALGEYEKNPSSETYNAFADSAEPSRQELVRRLNRVPGATGSLVKMRADLLRLGKGEPELEGLDLDFRHLFASWFNRGFLVLRPISWESPAHILEKIIEYEAVHAIDSWDDLRRRLQPMDRRCFAFFHPSMPNEPLIFVEVALTQGIPNSVQSLLAEDDGAMAVTEADTAVFYSISNCQAGLAGISFGNSLIKQVVSDLAAELRGLKTFVTLSPIPLMTRWLKAEGYDPDSQEEKAMAACAAHYLLNAKGRLGLPFDPVARFHLGNGAVVHDVHGRADLSDKGLEQSGGAMVNYLYDLEMVAHNHEKFVNDKTVLASPKVRSLARTFPVQQSHER